MDSEHLSLEEIADLLSGEMHVEEVRARVVPHLAARCDECGHRLERVRQLQEEYDHWNESIAVREGMAAEALLEDLLSSPPEARAARMEQDEELHTWGLCQLLLRRCRDGFSQEPALALELAQLAIRLTEHLPPSAYHEEWVGDLLARAWAHRGNGQRVLGELGGAHGDLRRAQQIFDKSGSGRPAVAAEILDFTASLRRVQGHLDEADQLLQRAAALYYEEEDLHRVGRCELSRARVLEETGRIDEAIELLHRVDELLDREREPRLPLCVQHNLVCCLLEAERFEEAEQRVSQIRRAFGDVSTEIDRRRLQWLEGHIAFGLGRLEESERIFRQAQAFFLEQRLDVDAARASLDLALLFAVEGRETELHELTRMLLPLFESKDLQQDALAVLALFLASVEQRRATESVIRELIRKLGRACHGLV